MMEPALPTPRLTARFEAARAERRAVLVAYIMGGDPDLETSLQALTALRDNGADIIELGAPFTDPMADGPAIQKAGLRSLEAGTTLRDVLALAARFRETDPDTPLILMGYANPVHAMGYQAFADAAAGAGIDGVITVDLPPEEDTPLRTALQAHDLSVIRLATPTTDAVRVAKIVEGASGFIYYVAVAGVTGAGAAGADEVAGGIARVRAASGLPVCVGFGVRTPDQAADLARVADGVVVGSAFVEHAEQAAASGTPAEGPSGMGRLAQSLSVAIRAVRRDVTV